MPRDDWGKARARDIAKRAAWDYASNNGYVHFDSVYEELIPQVDEVPESKRPTRRQHNPPSPPQNLTEWLNRERGRLPPGEAPERFERDPRTGEIAAIPLITRALKLCRDEDRPFVVLAVKRIGDAAIQVVVESLRSKESAICEYAVAVFAELGEFAGPAVARLQREACSTAASCHEARKALARLEGSPRPVPATAACDAPPEIDGLIMAIVRIDSRTDCDYHESRLLGRGKAGVDGLLRALKCGDNTLVLTALRLLPGFGSRAAPAIPMLERIAVCDPVRRPEIQTCLTQLRIARSFGRHSPDPPNVRRTATAGIEGLPIPMPPKVALLIEALRDTDAGVRFAASRALSRLGLDARDALPALHAAWRSGDVHLKSVVMEAIRALGQGVIFRPRRSGKQQAGKGKKKPDKKRKRNDR